MGDVIRAGRSDRVNTPDHSSAAGAARLASRLTAYWLDRGQARTFEPYYVTGMTDGSVHHEIYGVREAVAVAVECPRAATKAFTQSVLEKQHPDVSYHDLFHGGSTRRIFAARLTVMKALRDGLGYTQGQIAIMFNRSAEQIRYAMRDDVREQRKQRAARDRDARKTQVAA